MKVKAKKSTLRTVLVILSNRLNRLQKARYFEIVCDEKGNILKEQRLRAQPRKPVYDEVWENDEGKTDLSFSHSFKRKYRHALEKAKA